MDILGNSSNIDYLRTKQSKELITMMESTYARYKETPKWHYLQTLFRLTLSLGIEIGKQETIHNFKNKNKWDKQEKKSA